jgi:hypothetical protein
MVKIYSKLSNSKKRYNYPDIRRSEITKLNSSMTTPSRVIIKLSKIEHKDRIPQALKEKYITYKGLSIYLPAEKKNLD